MKIHKLCLFDSQVPFSTKLPSNMAINIQFSWSFHFCFVIQISFRLICSFISMHKMPWIPQHCKYLPSFSPAGRAQGLHCPAQCTDWDFVNSYTDTVTSKKNPLKPSLIKSKQVQVKVFGYEQPRHTLIFKNVKDFETFCMSAEKWWQFTMYIDMCITFSKLCLRKAPQFFHKFFEN